MADPNPFDHGTTTVSYAPLEQDLVASLSRIAYDGWGIEDICMIEQLQRERGIPIYKVETLNSEYLLKPSRFTDERLLDVLLRSLQFCEEQGVKTSHVITTQDERVYHHAEDGRLFCLYDFLDSELFDGSEERLCDAAQEVAHLHDALHQFPKKNEIRAMRGSLMIHDREELLHLFDVIRKKEVEYALEGYVRGLVDELDEASEQIYAQNIDKLPLQVTHNDLHPHNFLYDSSGLRAIIDSDLLVWSQRARDVALGMHRLGRTFGEKTERKQDCGADISERAKLFVNTYLAHGNLTDEELRLLPYVARDESLRRVMIILRRHYLEGNLKYTKDRELQKQVTLLRETQQFA